MSDVSTNLYKSQLLDYYYQRRAESSINKGSRFLISKAVFGTSSLVTKKGDGTYEIGELPKAFDLAKLTSQFCTINLVPTYSGGIITVRMDLDQSQLQEGKTTHSTLWLFWITRISQSPLFVSRKTRCMWAKHIPQLWP